MSDDADAILTQGRDVSRKNNVDSSGFFNSPLDSGELIGDGMDASPRHQGAKVESG